jgi:hypothetical protein
MWCIATSGAQIMRETRQFVPFDCRKITVGKKKSERPGRDTAGPPPAVPGSVKRTRQDAYFCW